MATLTMSKDVVFLEGGLFEVHRNGKIYRKTKYGKKECTIQKTSRNGKYRSVSAMKNGKQKRFYVHRLMAQAFIPNPENKPQINHIDGDPSNNNIENLEWVTAKENILHAYETGLAPTLETSEQCVSCKNKTMNKDRVCPECKNETKRIEMRKLRSEQLIHSLESVELSILNENEKIAINHRRKAMTYEEIGNLMGVTRQRVEQLIKKSIAKSEDFMNRNIVTRKSTENYNPISKNKLWNIRKSRRIHQEELADLLNISKTTYSSKENNPEKFKISEARKICCYFDLSLNDLF